MAFWLVLVNLAQSTIVKIDKECKGPILTELVKSPMYAKEDTYGKFNSSIQIKCKGYEGKESSDYGFVAIADSQEYEKILNLTPNKTHCEYLKNLLVIREPLSSGAIEYPVEKTDTYYTFLIICSKTSVSFIGEINSLNPYGYVSADLLPLIPVLLT